MYYLSDDNVILLGLNQIRKKPKCKNYHMSVSGDFQLCQSKLRNHRLKLIWRKNFENSIYF